MRSTAVPRLDFSCLGPDCAVGWRKQDGSVGKMDTPMLRALILASPKGAAACRPAGSFQLEKVVALVDAVHHLVDVDEEVPPLVRLAAAGDAAAVQRYLQGGDGLEARDAAGRTPLHWAAGAGRKRLVGALLALGATVGARDRRGGSPLHHAVQGRSAAAARLLLAAGASAGARDGDGRTPLMRAAAAGAAPLCDLLTAGVLEPALDAVDHKAQTALHLAAEAGRAAAVRVLVARGATVNAVDDGQRVPLHSALLFYHKLEEELHMARHYPKKRDADGKGEAESGDPAEVTRQMVEALLEGEDAAVSACHRDELGMTPLTWALRLRLPAVAKALMEVYSPDYRTDTFGRTALHWAARAGDAYVVSRLVRYAFSLWKADMQGSDSLMAAVESRHTGTVRALIGGADYNSRKNETGHTALHIAVAFGDAAMTQCLLELGAKLDCVDREGRTALFRALEMGEAGREVAQLLLSAGAFQSQGGSTDARGRSLLHAAAEGGDEQMVRALLRLRASPRALDVDGASPLVCALREQHREVAAVLLQRSHLQLAADGRGRTPLHWAAAAGWREEARALYEAGCDTTQPDQFNRSAIVTAAECHHWELAGEMFDWWLAREHAEERARLRRGLHLREIDASEK